MKTSIFFLLVVFVASGAGLKDRVGLQRTSQTSINEAESTCKCRKYFQQALELEVDKYLAKDLGRHHRNKWPEWADNLKKKAAEAAKNIAAKAKEVGAAAFDGVVKGLDKASKFGADMIEGAKELGNKGLQLCECLKDEVMNSDVAVAMSNGAKKAANLAMTGMSSLAEKLDEAGKAALKTSEAMVAKAGALAADAAAASTKALKDAKNSVQDYAKEKIC